jgi:hypothetical protein
MADHQLLDRPLTRRAALGALGASSLTASGALLGAAKPAGAKASPPRTTPRPSIPKELRPNGAFERLVRQQASPRPSATSQVATHPLSPCSKPEAKGEKS